MKVSEPIYDRGSSPVREDGAVIAPPFYAVFDAASAPFSSDAPRQHFGSINDSQGLSGGEMAARLTETAFAVAATLAPGASVEDILRTANSEVRKFQAREGVPTDDPGRLAGTTFAGVKVENGKVSGMYGGDAFALFAFRSGQAILTRNQVHGHDTAMNAMINDFKREVASERGTTLEVAQHDKKLWKFIIGEMWKRFRVPLMEARREDVNNPKGPRGGYAFLNGQSEVECLWQPFAFERSELEAVLLFSDGLVPWEGMLKKYSLGEIATRVYGSYRSAGRHEEGLRHLLRVARNIEEDTFIDGYTKAEAIAVALDFSDEK